MEARISAHARTRSGQRNLTASDLSFLMAYGREAHCGGVLHLFLGDRDIPAEMMSDDSVAKLVGTTLILAKDDCSLITAYRNKKAWKAIRKKSKWDLSRTGRRRAMENDREACPLGAFEVASGRLN